MDDVLGGGEGAMEETDLQIFLTLLFLGRIQLFLFVKYTFLCPPNKSSLPVYPSTFISQPTDQMT